MLSFVGIIEQDLRIMEFIVIMNKVFLYGDVMSEGQQ